ncbi:unnamed protein product [Ilex paraguariensis]|uniref:Uncharacterized protein n=1 Tax=Ilex paraguariensis TaxID=185542 RepID=A0ABC8S1E4_9AQUA
MRLLLHEIFSKKKAQFDEELKHLAQISSIAVGIEEGDRGFGVLDMYGHDFITTSSPKLQNVDVFSSSDFRNVRFATVGVVGDHSVRWWARWEEGELGGD